MDRISMADLLARNLAIDWFEAVSLEREVCAVLISERVQESTPELGQILLGANGKVTITGTAHGDAPVRRLGQLLQALLRTSEPPVTLRLVLSEATATPPVYASVTDLDAALAYFERPDRTAVLKALYERAVKSERGAAEPSAVQELDVIAPLPSAPVQAVPKRQGKKSDTRTTLLATGAAVAVVAAVFAYQRGAFPGGSVRSAGGATTAAVDKAVLSTVSLVTQIAGMGKLVEPGETAPASVPPPIDSPTPRYSVTRVTLAGVPVKLFDLEPAEEIQPHAESPADVAPAVLEASAEPKRAIDTTLYGPGDRNVAAPVAIRPHIPTVLPDAVHIDQLARIELVVAPDGVVESVKLIPGASPVTVTEAMLLSAAKAWRFNPATKEGEPVRYKKTVFLSEK